MNKSIAGFKKINLKLASECEALRLQFVPAKGDFDLAAAYNPLVYASRPYEKYLELFGSSPKKVIFLGMNPGPWGMAQTGIPFGEIAAVRDWLGIEAAVDRPEYEHPKRPIEGFACQRSEVSGRRLWGLFRERFVTPAAFFRDHFVANYCPLVFMKNSGANLTPDKLPAELSAPLFEACDRALFGTIVQLQPEWVIGVGAFAEKRAEKVRSKFGHNFSTARILHPSPASPKANSGWDTEVIKTLKSLGVWK